MAREHAFVPKLFISYTRKDKRVRDELIKHLSILERQEKITSWSDGEIRPGEAWADEIRIHLQTAHLILLLLSSDFLASDYCYSVEMVSALERHASGQARVIPIILRPVDWQKTPLSGLQALPTNGKPVVYWKVRDEAFLDIVRGIEKTIENWTLPGESMLLTEELSGAQPSTSSCSSFFPLEQQETLFPSSMLRDTSKKTSCVNQEIEGQHIVVKLAEAQSDESKSVRAFLCTLNPGRGTVEVLTLTDEALLNVAASIHTTAQGSMIGPTFFPQPIPIPDSEYEGEQLSPERGRDNKNDELYPPAHVDLKRVPLKSNQQDSMQLIEEPIIPLTGQEKRSWSRAVNRLCSLVFISYGCALSLGTISFLLIYSDIRIYFSLLSSSISSWLLSLFMIIFSLFIVVLLLALYVKATPFIFRLCQRALQKGPLFDDLGL